MLSFLSLATPTTALPALSLHDALPICPARWVRAGAVRAASGRCRLRRVRLARHVARIAGVAPSELCEHGTDRDRKSTRLNSSHVAISYAVFCLKKKKQQNRPRCQDGER